MQTCIGSENRLNKRERDKGNWTAGAITTCIGSKTQNVKLTEMNVNVMSVCGSTCCLSERRSMELSIMLDLT